MNAAGTRLQKLGVRLGENDGVVALGLRFVL
jgi:hypothetical protein